MRALLITAITALFLTLPTFEASAQAARTAAQRSGSPPPAASMLVHVPAEMSAVMVGDVEALAGAFSDSLDLGFDAEPLLRQGLANAMGHSSWTEHGVHLEQARRGLIAFHEPSDRAVLVTDAAAVNVPTLSPNQPYQLGYDAFLHQLDSFYGVTTEGGPWQLPATPFSLETIWPEAAELASSAIWWAYLSDPELFRELDREFQYQLSAAGASRGFVAVAADASVTVLADTDVAGAERFFGRVQTTAATWVSDSPSQVLERLHFEAALSRVSIESVGAETVAIRLPSPSCGGLTQQAVAVGMVTLAWISGEERGRAVDGTWAPQSGLIAESCDAEAANAGLAWEVMRLVPDESAALGVIVDLHAAYSRLGRTLGGAAPYVLDEGAFEDALDSSDLGAILQPEGRTGLVVTESGVDFSFGGVVPDELAALLGLQPTAVAGIGNVFGNIAPTLADSEPYPEQWQSLQDAAPEEALAVILVNAALAQTLLSETPSMSHGAFSNAIAESSGLVFALDADGRYSMRIHGIPPSAADAVRENLLALARDAADVGTNLLPESLAFGAQFVEQAIEVEPFDTGVEVRLVSDPSPLIMAGSFVMLGRLEPFLDNQPTSMPSAASP